MTTEDMVALLGALISVELEARNLCAISLTTRPELRTHTLKLETAIREMDQTVAMREAR